MTRFTDVNYRTIKEFTKLTRRALDGGPGKISVAAAKANGKNGEKTFKITRKFPPDSEYADSSFLFPREDLKTFNDLNEEEIERAIRGKLKKGIILKNEK